MTPKSKARTPIEGTRASERLFGTLDADLIEGGHGSDTLHGSDGNDLLFGKTARLKGPGVPTWAELIQSTHHGSADRANTIFGDLGDDILVGRERADLLHGDNDSLSGPDGKIVFDGHKGKISYADVAPEDQAMVVTGIAPGKASDRVWPDNGEGAGIGNKTVDYLYRVDHHGREGMSWDSGEIMHFDVGTQVRSAEVTLRDLDQGERVRITAKLGDQTVGTWEHTGTTSRDIKNDRTTLVVRPDGAVTFDTLEVEALVGPTDGGRNGSTSFGVSDVTFVTATAGHDTLIGGSDRDSLFGGHGDDLFIEGLGSGDGNDLIDGGAGSDTVDYSGKHFNGVPGNLPGLIANLMQGSVTVSTSRVTDTITYKNYALADDRPGGQEVTRVFDIAGSSVLTLRNGGTEVDTVTSVENVVGTSRQDVLIGNAQNNWLFGGDRSDLLIGGGGSDRLDGDDGGDSMHGGSGSDSLNGGLGQDTLWAGSGNDTLSGGDDDDQMFGRAGNDRFLAGHGDDLAEGGTGRDAMSGGAGQDTLQGGPGRDTLAGDAGDDSLLGGKDDDDLKGGEGNDALFGNTGNDTLSGGAGADTLVGTAGDDVLIGGTGADSLSGGSGADDFVFYAKNADAAVDIITDLRSEDTVQMVDYQDAPDTVDQAWLDSVLTINVTTGLARLSHADTIIDFELAEWMDADDINAILLESIEFV